MLKCDLIKLDKSLSDSCSLVHLLYVFRAPLCKNTSQESIFIRNAALQLLFLSSSEVSDKVLIFERSLDNKILAQKNS